MNVHAVKRMQEFGRRYPRAGYGGAFRRWLCEDNPQPYKSWGNGAAMRVSACGWAGRTLDEVKAMSRAVTEVTHNHPEGIKGAQAVAAAIFLARIRKSKEEIGAYLRKNFYPLDRTLDEIRLDYGFYESCQKTVPEAVTAFFESTSYEDAIRNAISLGGDSDTLGAITGAIAWSYYRFNTNESGPDYWKKSGTIWPQWCEDLIREYRIDDMLPPDFVDLIERFDEARMLRMGTLGRLGYCTPILPECQPLTED